VVTMLDDTRGSLKMTGTRGTRAAESTFQISEYLEKSHASPLDASKDVRREIGISVGCNHKGYLVDTPS
jgi:hypothetical protein